MKKKTIGLLFPFYIGLIILCVIMAFSFSYVIQIPDKQAERGQWVGHTHQVISQLNRLESDIYKAALANQMKSDSLFTAARKQTYEDLNALQQLTADNSSQQKNTTQLSTLISQGLFKPDTISQALSTMRHEEENLLITRQQTWYFALLNTQKTLVITQLLLFSVILLSYFFLFKELIKRRNNLVASLIEEDRLHAIVALQNTVTTSSLEIHEMMRKVTDCTCELVKADGSVIERVEGDEMVYDAASGSGEPFLGLRISVMNSFSGKAVRENTILKCDDAETNPFVDRAACKRVGVRSMVVVPLQSKDGVFGVLKVFSSERAAFSNKDVDTMEIIAALLAARITEASNFSAMKEVNRDLTLQKEKLLDTNAELGELAVTDGLTGLNNHRYFMERLNKQFQYAQHSQSPFSILLMDVDQFKKFNDSFGHIAGDQVLKKVGAILKKALRDTDVVARYGGEEFAVVLPAMNAEEAVLIAERLRADIAKAEWEHRMITMSIGVSTYKTEYPDVKSLLESADKALYAAKDSGRNCVRQADQPA